MSPDQVLPNVEAMLLEDDRARDRRILLESTVPTVGDVSESRHEWLRRVKLWEPARLLRVVGDD